MSASKQGVPVLHRSPVVLISYQEMDLMQDARLEVLRRTNHAQIHADRHLLTCQDDLHVVLTKTHYR